MEAGWSRMNDLIVIQASQVRKIYSSMTTPTESNGFTRACALTFSSKLTTLGIEEQSLDTIIGTTLKGGRD